VTLGVASPQNGFVTDLDPLRLGRCAMTLGAGRLQPGDRIDPHVGIVLHKRLGDPITRGEPLALVQASSAGAADAALTEVLAAYRFGAAAPARRPVILERFPAS
jgi:pyrimidine-nucleoside phosphorylase